MNWWSKLKGMVQVNPDRPKVGRLLRLNYQWGYFYYAPDGHSIGPFRSWGEREDHLQANYDEISEHHHAEPDKVMVFVGMECDHNWIDFCTGVQMCSECLAAGDQ